MFALGRNANMVVRLFWRVPFR